MNEALEPLWPVVIFEADDWPVLVVVPAGLVDLYEDDYWDEVVVAFDREFHRVIVVPGDDGRPALRRGDDHPRPTEFREHASRALLRFDRKTLFGWKPAGAETAEQIDGWDSETLRRAFMTHFFDS